MATISYPVPRVSPLSLQICVRAYQMPFQRRELLLTPSSPSKSPMVALFLRLRWKAKQAPHNYSTGSATSSISLFNQAFHDCPCLSCPIDHQSPAAKNRAHLPVVLVATNTRQMGMRCIEAQGDILHFHGPGRNVAPQPRK
jgi:hypothetical protein